MRVPSAAVPVLFLGGLLAWSEWAHHRSSTRRLGDPRETTGRQVVLVLGCRDRGTRANLLNRHRVRVALRSIDQRASETVPVFCVGPVGGEVSEADLLQQYACDRSAYTGPYRIERRSRTTWENIANTTALLEQFDTVTIASNALHAEKARAYLWKQRPDIARRLGRADDHRFGEVVLLKPALAFVGLRNLRRFTRSSRSQTRNSP